MARPRTGTADEGSGSVSPSSGPGRRELIMVGAPDAELRITEAKARSLTGSELGPLADVAADPDVVIRPLFGPTEERVLAVESPQDVPVGTDGSGPQLVEEMARFYHVDAPDNRLDELAEQLQASPAVASAYIKPPADLPVRADVMDRLNDMVPHANDAPPASILLCSIRIYLNL
jgi:hypothetical protein